MRCLKQGQLIRCRIKEQGFNPGVSIPICSMSMGGNMFGALAL